jgi:hypothetical protein
MSQVIEITEEINNGTTNQTPITKSLNVDYVKGNQDRATGGSEIEMAGRSTKDSRIVSEDASTVLAAANAAPTTDIERLMALTVVRFPGKLEEATPVARNFAKREVVEFYANPQDAGQTVIVEAEDKNSAERQVYIVDEDYATVGALWVL